MPRVARLEKKSAVTMDATVAAHPMADLFSLRLGAIWSSFKKEHFSFWAICAYLVVEYVRPQSIIPSLDVLPWAKLFIVVSAICWLADKHKQRVSDPTNKWITAFLLVLILASFAALWPELSWKYFMDFFGWYVIYFLIVNIITNQRRFFIFLLIFLLASLKLAQHGARTWAMRGFSFTNWGLQGPEGFFQNSGELAIQMLIFTAIGFQFVVALRPWLSRLKASILLFCTSLGAMTVLGSSTRGGQLGLAIQAYMTFLRGRLSFKAIALVCLLSYGAWTALPVEQKQRFTEAGEDRTSKQRLLYWKRGVEMIEKYPVLGVGYFNFARYFQENHPEDVIMMRAEVPHNIFIQIGTDTGLTGLFVYVMLIYRGFRSTSDIRKYAKDVPNMKVYATLSKGFDSAFVGFLIAGQFVTVAYYPFMWIHLAMVVSLRHIVARECAPQATHRKALSKRSTMTTTSRTRAVG